MYYDRRVPPPLLDLLLPAAPVGWLVPWLSGEVAAAAGAHVQTRRDRGNRRHGSVQLYLGRTSPLEVRARGRGGYRLHADAFYRAMSPALFDRDLTAGDLAEAADSLRAHAERAARETHRSFVDGEAVLHAGLMRLYGPLATQEAPILALDSEARIGFDTLPEQVAFEARLPAIVGLPATEGVPRKLDLVAIDGEQGLLLVEVKADAEGLHRAAWQAAVQVARFRALLAEQPSWFTDVLGELAREKGRVGLLGRARVARMAPTPQLVPVVAAPDVRADWASSWRREVAPVVAASGGMLGGLRLWRLAADGRLAEDVAA